MRGVLDTHYVIKFISDLRQVGCFHWALWFPPPNNTDRHDVTEIWLKVTFKHRNPNPTNHYETELCSNIDQLLSFIIFKD